MAVQMIPYGRLADGKYGILVDDATRSPLASVVEIMQTLPATSSSDNFVGRLVFSIADKTAYIWSNNPSPVWTSLDAQPAQVGNVNGNPPTIPTPQVGSLFYDNDTGVLFLWDGVQWQGVGGKYAAQIIEQKYNGDGIAISFPLGTLETINPQYVEVFLDGVRQMANPLGDYSVVGTNVVFPLPVPAGVKILLRSMVSQGLMQNAQITNQIYTAIAGQTTFSVGVPGVDPSSMFVFVNGSIKTLNVDYTVSSVNTTITSIVKITPTVARATTLVAHGGTVGQALTLHGAVQTQYNNRLISIASISAPTSFDFAVSNSDPASATGNPILYYTPTLINDSIIFTTPLNDGDIVQIRSLKNIVTAPSTGEANVLSSVGTGVGLDAGKVGVTLQLKSLKAGNNVNISSTATEVTFNVSSGLSSEDRVGINGAFYQITGTESYVGVRNTSVNVTIDLSTVPTGPASSGRRIHIQDESGGAILHNIIVSTGGANINGSANPYVINTNYGSVTLVYDGAAWYVVAKVTN